jgi:hypothetical protein
VHGRDHDRVGPAQQLPVGLVAVLCHVAEEVEQVLEAAGRVDRHVHRLGVLQDPGERAQVGHHPVIEAGDGKAEGGEQVM